MADIRATGPLSGRSIPVHGGTPGNAGCGGCTDCCHLPKISITDEEAIRVERRYRELAEPLGSLVIRPDADNEGWSVMEGPCGSTPRHAPRPGWLPDL